MFEEDSGDDILPTDDQLISRRQYWLYLFDKYEKYGTDPLGLLANELIEYASLTYESESSSDSCEEFVEEEEYTCTDVVESSEMKRLFEHGTQAIFTRIVLWKEQGLDFSFNNVHVRNSFSKDNSWTNEIFSEIQKRKTSSYTNKITYIDRTLKTTHSDISKTKLYDKQSYCKSKEEINRKVIFKKESSKTIYNTETCGFYYIKDDNLVKKPKLTENCKRNFCYPRIELKETQQEQLYIEKHRRQKYTKTRQRPIRSHSHSSTDSDSSFHYDRNKFENGCQNIKMKRFASQNENQGRKSKTKPKVYKNRNYTTDSDSNISGYIKNVMDKTPPSSLFQEIICLRSDTDSFKKRNLIIKTDAIQKHNQIDFPLTSKSKLVTSNNWGYDKSFRALTNNEVTKLFGKTLGDIKSQNLCLFHIPTLTDSDDDNLSSFKSRYDGIIVYPIN